MSDQSETLLRLEELYTNISVPDGLVHALNGVSLSVGRGETLGIVGESGCGKTMTALSVMGLLPQGGQVASGKIILDGTDLTAQPKSVVRKLRGTKVGMIFQDPLTSLNPTMKIGVQVSEPLRVHNHVSRQEAWDQAVHILRRVGMPRAESVAASYPHQLSGGMRQRAMIAMALICQPSLLIADEPTTALDVTTQKQILDLIDEMREEFDMGVILITHDLGVVAGHTDRIAVMYGGMIVEEATTNELFASPMHRYTASLLAALPERALETGGTLVSIPGSPPNLRNLPTGCQFAPRCSWSKDDCCAQVPHLESIIGSGKHAVSCFHPATPGMTEPPHSDKRISITGSDSTAVPHPDGNELILRLESISKNYEVGGKGFFHKKAGIVSAVDNVTLRMQRGTTYGLVGESGCGKSTLGRLVAALEAPTDGHAFIDAKKPSDDNKKSSIHRDVQMMFQDSYAAMDPRMRIDGILSEPVKIQRTLGRKALADKLDDILDAVGLPRDTLNRYPHEFSGGQLQRIGLARSLMLDPELIVADEPVSALDVSLQAQVLNLMKSLQDDRELSYLFISHDLAVVQYMADRIGVMYLGGLVEEGPADQIVAQPWHPYTQVLIESVPVPDPARERHAVKVEITGEPPSALNPPSGCRFRTRCPFVQEICKKKPALVGGERKVACHFPLSAMESKLSANRGRKVIPQSST